MKYTARNTHLDPRKTLGLFGLPIGIGDVIDIWPGGGSDGPSKEEILRGVSCPGPYSHSSTYAALNAAPEDLLQRMRDLFRSFDGGFWTPHLADLRKLTNIAVGLANGGSNCDPSNWGDVAAGDLIREAMAHADNLPDDLDFGTPNQRVPADLWPWLSDQVKTLLEAGYDLLSPELQAQVDAEINRAAFEKAQAGAGAVAKDAIPFLLLGVVALFAVPRLLKR